MSADDVNNIAVVTVHGVKHPSDVTEKFRHSWNTS